MQMHRIKVLHLTTNLGVGGALDNTLLTVQGMSRDRYEVHLAAGMLDDQEGYTAWEMRARESADELHLFSDLRRSVRLTRDMRALRQLTNFLRSQSYDIVHTHCSKAGILGRIAARRAGVPVVVHTCHAFGWQVAHPFQASRYRQWTAAAKKRLYVKLDRYGASLSDSLITVCDSNKEEAIDLKLAPVEKLITIYSGVDVDRLQTKCDRADVCRELGLDARHPVVGTIGRLSTQKAPLDFVRAARSVLRQRPDVQFILVGDGPLESAVRKAIGDEHRIRVLGFRENVAEILSILDAYVVPSLWEGLGRTLTEAMIMRVPIAATAVNGVPELVAHRKTGLLSPPKDFARLAVNILWLLDHPEEAREMCQRGRERVLPDFCADRMVEQIAALYERLLAQRHVDRYSHVESCCRGN